MIYYECTACKVGLKASGDRAGRRNQCPRCGVATVVPALPRSQPMKTLCSPGSPPRPVQAPGPSPKPEAAVAGRSLGGILVYALGFAFGLYAMLQVTGVFNRTPAPSPQGIEKVTALAGSERNGNSARGAGRTGEQPMDAQANKALEEVKNFIRKGGAVNSDYAKGMTALHWAARHGFVQVAEFLINNGADLNAKERAIAQSTPLHVAATYNHLPMAKLLIARGARVDATDMWGSTPLQYAAFNGNNELIDLLLSKGANVNHQETRYGITALHAAVAGGKLSVGKSLISKGVNLNVRNHAGETALGTAIRTRQTDFVTLLKEHGLRE